MPELYTGSEEFETPASIRDHLDKCHIAGYSNISDFALCTVEETHRMLHENENKEA